MATENKPSSPRPHLKMKKELTQLRRRLSKNEKGAFKSTRNWTGFKGKTLWDWLQLLGVLAIPIVVVGATIGFGLWQQHLADTQHRNDIQLANDQQQEATLKAYLDDMTTLLLDKKLGSQAVADKAASDEAAIVARAKTLTALRRLTDPRRKVVVVQFLYEAHLIGFSTSSVTTSLILHTYIIDLRGADLSLADLRGADLRSTDLSNANNLTQQQLDQVFSCKGATLPQGLTCYLNP